MKHPTETQLNEYLDNALESTARTRISVHLTNCADCQARLASLQTVFLTLAALPDEKLRRDLTPAVLQSLPRQPFRLAWRLAFAIQAGISLGVIFLFAPIVMGRIVGIIQGLTGRLAGLEVKLPAPGEFHFNLPVIRLPHPPELTFPIAITHANLPIWLILGIAAALLFLVGNFSLVFHSTSEDPK